MEVNVKNVWMDINLMNIKMNQIMTNKFVAKVVNFMIILLDAIQIKNIGKIVIILMYLILDVKWMNVKMIIIFLIIFVVV